MKAQTLITVIEITITFPRLPIDVGIGVGSQNKIIEHKTSFNHPHLTRIPTCVYTRAKETCVDPHPAPPTPTPSRLYLYEHGPLGLHDHLQQGFDQGLGGGRDQVEQVDDG